MPSIFIWKADAPNTSKKTIRFYSGSNWVLEDNDYTSKSYMYLEQIVITESDNSVITFRSKDMPQDWVGTELLEVSNVPYEFVKSDNYGTLEKIGDWMRFTTKSETIFNADFLKDEFINIQKWINQKNKKYNDNIKKYEQDFVPKNNKTDISLDQQKVHLNFQEFLIKYTLPNLPQISNLNTSMPIRDHKNNSNYRGNNYNVNKSNLVRNKV
jgi:hypothetical protein